MPPGRRLRRKTARHKTPYAVPKHGAQLVWTSSSSSTIAPSSLDCGGSEGSGETSSRPSSLYRKRSATEAGLAEGSCEPSSPPSSLDRKRSATEAGGTEPRARFLRAVQDGSDDMCRLLAAMQQDHWVARGEYKPGEHLTWEEFCDLHEIDGDRFKNLLEPLMDVETPFVCDDTIMHDTWMRLREFGGDDYLVKIDFLVGGCESGLKLWVMCAMFLARNPSFEAPACMSPEPEQV